MILFSAFLVVVAVGLLVAGVVTSKLLLVYAAIGVSGVALLALVLGAAVKWRALFGKPKTAASDVVRQEPVPAQAAGVQAPQAQSGLQGYPRPSAAGPVWEPAAGSLWEPAAARPGAAEAAASATDRNHQADTATGGPSAGGAAAAALWESAVPPTGTFPRVQSAAQAPPTRPADVSRPLAAFTSHPSPAPATASAPSDTPEFTKAPAQSAATSQLASAIQPGAGDQPSTTSQPSAAKDPQPAKDPEPASAPAGQTAQQAPEPGPAASQPAVVPPSALPQPAGTVGAPMSPAAGSPPAAEGAPASAPPETTPQPSAPESADGIRSAGSPESVGASPAAPLAATPLAATPLAATPPAAAPADPTSVTSAGTSPPAPDPGPDPDPVVTVVPGVPRYHKASCLLIRFMGEDDLEKRTLAAAREAGCTPCRACLPDQPGRAPE